MFKRALGLVALLSLLAACTPAGPPSVRATLSPAAGAVGFPVDEEISIRFNAPMNASTLEGAFTLASEGGEVAGEFIYSAEQRRATFTPDSALTYETEYTATLASTVRSAAGGLIAGTTGGVLTWTFITEVEPDELPEEPDVTDVTVSPATAAVEVGGTIALTAVVTAVGGADESVIWSSSDEGMATVDEDGVVAGIAEGQVTITATSQFNTEISGDAIVTVVVGQTVTNVTVDPDEASIAVGETFELLAVVTAAGGADESVTWTTSDPDIATVDADGAVTGVAEGVATITATSNFDDTVSGTATITVVSPSVTDVTVSPAEATLEVGDLEQLTADVTVVGAATDAVTWSSSDEDVATVDAEGVVVAVAPGTAVITATSDHDSSVSGSATVNVAGITGLTVDPVVAELVIGGTIQLEAETVALHGADDSVEWVSNDEDVATVDEDGLVTAGGAGTTTITVVSVYDGAFTADVTINVYTELSADDYVTALGYVVGVDMEIDAPVVTGGATPYTYELTEGALPDGVALDAEDGTISGVATEAGAFSGTVTVSDALGQAVEVEFSLLVVEPLAVNIAIRVTSDVDEEIVAQPIYVSGGLAPFEYSVVIVDVDAEEWQDRFENGPWTAHPQAEQNPLHPGIELGPDGVISGTPTTVEFRRTYVQTTDAIGQVDVTQLEINITPPTF